VRCYCFGCGQDFDEREYKGLCNWTWSWDTHCHTKCCPGIGPECETCELGPHHMSPSYYWGPPGWNEHGNYQSEVSAALAILRGSGIKAGKGGEALRKALIAGSGVYP